MFTVQSLADSLLLSWNSLGIDAVYLVRYRPLMMSANVARLQVTISLKLFYLPLFTFIITNTSTVLIIQDDNLIF
jgi:hypothetical protein